jgi:hypothetical protein
MSRTSSEEENFINYIGTIWITFRLNYRSPSKTCIFRQSGHCTYVSTPHISLFFSLSRGGGASRGALTRSGQGCTASSCAASARARRGTVRRGPSRASAGSAALGKVNERSEEQRPPRAPWPDTEAIGNRDRAAAEEYSWCRSQC